MGGSFLSNPLPMPLGSPLSFLSSSRSCFLSGVGFHFAPKFALHTSGVMHRLSPLPLSVQVDHSSLACVPSKRKHLAGVVRVARVVKIREDREHCSGSSTHFPQPPPHST